MERSIGKSENKKNENEITLRKNFEEIEKQEIEPLHYGCGVRQWQWFMLFWGNALTYAMRVNLSIAIVQMNDGEDNNTFGWDSTTIQLILSSFYWGYTINQIPGGYISKRWGSKYTLLFAIFGSAVLTLLTPVVTVHLDWIGLLVLRILLGLIQGVMMPALMSFCAKWCPADERARGLVFVGSGLTFGTFITFLVSGQIAYALGWTSIFYLFGGLGVVWSILWTLFAASTPAQHKYITQEEKDYILTALDETEDTHKTYVRTPWLAMCLSIPFWATVIQHVAQSWVITLLQTQIPTYFNSIFNVRIDANGLMSSLPYIGRFIMQFAFIALEYVIITRKWMTLGVRRRFFHIIGQFIPAIIFLAVGFLTNVGIEWAVTLLVIGNGANAAIGMGGSVNPIDLAPNHAGIIMGFTNAAGGVISIATPIVVGWIVTDLKDVTQWRIIFIITSVISVIGALVFVFLGSTRIQKWNDPDKKTDGDTNKTEGNNNK